MKAWKMLATILVSILVLGVTPVLAETTQPTYTIENTIIVLPTTKIVGEVPLHINEDAIAGAKLGAWLMYKSIFTNTITEEKTVTVSADYHSVIIRDSNQMYYLTDTDMPDVDLPLAETPDNKHITIYVNFSRVTYNTTANTYKFGDGTMGIKFTTNSSPIKLWDTDSEVLVKMNSNNTELYIYTFNNDVGYKEVGETFEIDGLKINILDISTASNRVLVQIIPPVGDPMSDILDLGTVKVYYIDNDGKFVEANTTDINTLLSEGAEKIYKFTVTDIFTGLSTNMVRIEGEYYDKIKEYKDGQVYMGNWVWNIMDENTFELKLHVDSNNGFPEVVLSQNNPVIKLPVGDLELKAYWVKNDDGNVIDHYFRFVKPVTVEEKVTYETQTVVYNKPENIIWTDEQAIAVRPNSKNIIIIGGWVSNKAWSWLSEIVGNDTIEQWKNEVMSNGYIVKVVSDGGRKIVVLAGKDYTGTAQAVDYFITNILLNS